MSGAVLLAGLPEDAAAALARALPGVSVRRTADAPQTLAALERGGVALLVLDDALPGLPAREALRRARALPASARVPVFYLLSPGAEGLTREAVEELGIARVFFHPVDADAVAREAAAVAGLAPGEAEERREGVAAAVSAVWERFKDAVFGRVAVIEETAVALLEGELDPELRRRAEREAHKLAGSVGTFGFAAGSRIAREVETLLGGTTPLGSAEALRLSEAAVALRRELGRPPGAPLPASSGGGEGRRTLLVVEDDPELGERLAMEAEGRGLSAHVARTLAQAREALAGGRPDAALLDLSLDDDPGGQGVLALLGELAGGIPPVPVLVLTARTSFADRVDVARLGGRGFLQKPIPPARVLDAVEQTLRSTAEEGTSVLVVDDDPSVTEAVRSLLEPRGVRVHALPDPLRFWDALEAVSPDVLVLDVDMPHLTGIELCRVVRNDARWTALPILFLTARTDPATVQRIFSAGADDYVAKPFVGPELVTRITNRLERVQLHRSLADTDALTSVANRRKSEETIGQFLRLAARQGQPFSLGLLDLDHFKQINDRAGHGTGDEVLRRVAKVLLKSFRAEDTVARWGGEEFVVGMYGMEKDDGVQRLADALEALRGEEFRAPDGELLPVTFSAGVAQYPLDGADLAALYRAADDALYQAKEGGRNRVLPAGWTPESPERAEAVDVLLVDDDEALANLLIHALETRGYRTRWLRDGQSAADRLLGPRPELRARVVLLDVDLPGLDGLGLLRALARDRVLDRTRVIMLTVRSLEAEVVQALDLGAFDHVAKPFSVPVLLQRVRRALRV